MGTVDWTLYNKSISQLVLNEEVHVAIVVKWIPYAEILKNKLYRKVYGNVFTHDSMRIDLINGSYITFTSISNAEVKLRACSIDLLLYSNMIQYNKIENLLQNVGRFGMVDIISSEL